MQIVKATAREVAACPIHSDDPDHYHQGTCECFVVQEPAPRVSTMTVPPHLKVSLRAIGPRLAEKMLDGNTRNRMIRNHRVIQYAQQMQQGEWWPGGESAIVIDRDGVILNGQHRLAAVILSGTTQIFIIYTGVESKAQESMDRGLTRALGDALGTRQEHNVTYLAAALRWTHRLNYIEAIGGTAANYARAEHRPTVPHLLEILDENPDLRDSVKKMTLVCQHLHLRASSIAIHYRCSRLSGDDCDEFFATLDSGVGLQPGDPIMTFRNTLLAESKTRRMVDYHEAALLIKTWNFWRDGAQPNKIIWQGGGAHKGREPFPIPR